MASSIWQTEPRGTEETISGLNTYVSLPHSGSTDRAVVVISDTFGHKLKNTRLIADGFSQAGFFAVVPDLAQGDALDHKTFMAAPNPMELLFAWLPNHAKAQTMPQLDAFIDALRSEHGVMRVGTTGFSWGGKWSILEAGSDRVDAFIATHPSRVEIPENIEAIKKPGLFCLADGDFSFSEAAVNTAKDVLAKKPGLQIEFILYPGAGHGFAIHGDDKNEAVNAARNKALQDSIDFFKKSL